MGCDIHLYSETRKDGKWVADFADTLTVEQEEGEECSYTSMKSSYEGRRNYWLFGLLSKGVRTEWDWSFEERGIPEDISPEVKAIFDSWDGDGHSHSYLTVKELKEKATELMLNSERDAKDLLSSLVALIHGLPTSDNPDEQRVVFFFDN